ncbi:MAG: alpha/beta hydrolase [Chitinophagaceae bacterium]|nr:MAG: alpha/beta hydrolase [Chitinophagaceae bacterium]
MAATATAQVPKLYNHLSNETHTIHSRLLNEDLSFYIHAPKLDSSANNAPLPVMYLLDGDNHFHIVSAYIEYLRHWNVLPPIIVVGIISNNRVRELTPVKSLKNFDGEVDSAFKVSGGNYEFLQFIEQELVPYIETRHKTSPYKIFAGHSFGGLAVLNCLLTRPNMFDAYIAISPSLWFGNKHVLRLARQEAKKLKFKNKTLFCSVGNEDGTFKPDINQLHDIFQQNATSLTELFKFYPGEDHMTEPIPAYYDALRFIFKNWK